MPGKRDESFSREHRLRKSNDFRRVFSRGKRISTRHFVIYAFPNRLSFPRIGIQVKSKIGTAVTRNRIKRRVREVFRKHETQFRAPIDIIFIANRELADLDFRTFEKEFVTALGNVTR